MGLDTMDRRILTTIAEKFDCGPVGIDNLSTAIGEEAGTIEDVYEPFLVMKRSGSAHTAGTNLNLLGQSTFG